MDTALDKVVDTEPAEDVGTDPDRVVGIGPVELAETDHAETSVDMSVDSRNADRIEFHLLLLNYNLYIS